MEHFLPLKHVLRRSYFDSGICLLVYCRCFSGECVYGEHNRAADIGHDMQFSQMLDNGVSVIRSRYAVNNVNIEGWALYAEDLVYPYLTPEEQLFGIQTRLWRIVRMFLDPQIQLGLIKDERVIEVFTQELGVSKVMAGLELKRYKYEDIGQAPSYYEGYLIVSQMRAEAEKRLGAKFNLKCFNDRLLSFGLLPLSISSERMETVSHCP